MTTAETPTTEQDEFIGKVVDKKYRIARLCGQGGMGSVYEAENIAIGKRVALKFIDKDAASNRDSVSRFLREAQAASAAESLHIVQVFDVGETDDGCPYIVMELLRGENLGERLHRLGRISIREAVHIVVQTLKGLQRAHAVGIVHRDLKPENIFLVQSDDDPLFTKLVDFGVSKITRNARGLDPGTITRQGVVLGTPYYMSPEQAQALPDLDGRTDLWAVGAILYECITGIRPFHGDTYEQVIISICTTEAPNVRTLASQVPDPLASVIHRALRRDRTTRLQTAKEFIAALRAAVPDMVAIPPSFDSSSNEAAQAISASLLVEKKAAPSGPKTRVSWSAGHAGPIDVVTPDAAAKRARQRRNTGLRLGLVAVGVGAIAFLFTLSVLRPGEREKPAIGMVDSSTVPAITADTEVRILSATPGAEITMNGQPVADGVVRGPVGTTVQVRVAASGFVPMEATLKLDGTLREQRFDLQAQSSEPPGSASAASSSKPDAKAVDVKKPPTPHKGGSKPKSSGVAGGLQLKTDLP